MRSIMLIAAAALACASCAAGSGMDNSNASGGQAPSQARAQKICFDADDVQSFEYQPRNTMMITTRRKETYVLTLRGVCPDLASATAIGFTDAFTNDICSNARSSVVYNSTSFGPRTCRIVSIDRVPAN